MMFKAVEGIKKSYDGGQKGILLDIDETLSHTRVRYFEMYVKELGNPEQLTYETFVKNYGHTSRVPYWKTHPKFEELNGTITVNESVHANVELISGVDDYLRRLGQIVPIAGYLTARPNVLQNVTEQWIAKHGLPMAPTILCPRYVGNKHAWKAEILDYLEDEVLGIVDDNQDLLPEISNGYKGTIFVYEYAGQIDRPELDIVPCADWESVLNAVAQRVPKQS